MPLTGTMQIERTITINRPPHHVWRILAEPASLPRWVPAVDRVTDHAPDGEQVGAKRTCDVTLHGRRGQMVERCVEMTERSRIAFVVDRETFGMQRLFTDYGFALNLVPVDDARTQVRLETHYTPRTLIAAALNRLVVRRRIGRTCDEILDGLQRHAESLARS